MKGIFLRGGLFYGGDFFMGRIFLWGGFFYGGIFLCRSERLDLCKREKYALNEWLNSFMFLMTARLIWRQRGESDEGLRGGKEGGGWEKVSTGCY